MTATVIEKLNVIHVEQSQKRLFLRINKFTTFERFIA